MTKYFTSIFMTFFLGITGSHCAGVSDDSDAKAGASLRKFSLIFDSEDHQKSRTWLRESFGASHIRLGDTAPSLPTSVDLRSFCPPIYDQLTLSSCTANAIAAAIQVDQARQKLEASFMPSRLFIYYNERAIEGDPQSDVGASLSDGIRTICETGVCPETLWPYVDGPTQYAVKPTDTCYSEASKCVDTDNVDLASVEQDVTSIKSVLAQNIPVVFGAMLYDSFMSDTVASTGIVPLPNISSETLHGGHALMLAGYDDSSKMFIGRNSWGTSWGQNGYFQIPYDYVGNPNLASDFWRIAQVGPRAPVVAPVSPTASTDDTAVTEPTTPTAVDPTLDPVVDPTVDPTADTTLTVDTTLSPIASPITPGAPTAAGNSTATDSGTSA